MWVSFLPVVMEECKKNQKMFSGGRISAVEAVKGKWKSAWNCLRKRRRGKDNRDIYDEVKKQEPKGSCFDYDHYKLSGKGDIIKISALNSLYYPKIRCRKKCGR